MLFATEDGLYKGMLQMKINSNSIPEYDFIPLIEEKDIYDNLSGEHIKSIVQYSEDQWLCSVWDRKYMYIINTLDKQLTQRFEIKQGLKFPL